MIWMFAGFLTHLASKDLKFIRKPIRHFGVTGLPKTSGRGHLLGGCPKETPRELKNLRSALAADSSSQGKTKHLRPCKRSNCFGDRWTKPPRKPKRQRKCKLSWWHPQQQPPISSLPPPVAPEPLRATKRSLWVSPLWLWLVALKGNHRKNRVVSILGTRFQIQKRLDTPLGADRPQNVAAVGGLSLAPPKARSDDPGWASTRPADMGPTSRFKRPQLGSPVERLE